MMPTKHINAALIVFSLLATSAPDLRAQSISRIRVHAGQPLHTVSRYMTGACIEDVNHEVYGGIYSQMIFGESFQEPPAKANDNKARKSAVEPSVGKGTANVSGMWRPFHRGSPTGSFALSTQHPFIGNQSQRITFLAGAGEIGIENKGLNHWGMSFVAGKPYEGHLWVRVEKTTQFWVALESGNGGKTYAKIHLDAKPGDWQRLTFALTPDAADPAGRFVIKLTHPGVIDIGYAFLQPGDWGRYKGLPVRKDVADGLVAQGLTVLRYGGSMVNAPEYRWKKMIGPRDRRPVYKGTWYPYSSNGWGIIDFLEFCQAAGFLAVPDLNVNETPADIGDFIEYVNGPADSPWGRRRAADGHPAPFGLKYIELGNEEAVDESYWKKFRPLAQAIWSKDTSVIPVVGDFAYGEHIADPYHFKGAPRSTSLAAQKQILDFGRANHKPIWFDVHIWNDGPGDPGKQMAVLGELIGWLGKISPGADFKVCVFEENANNHSMRRALGHALVINGLERLGDRVPILCCANCLQCDGQNDNGWNQGLLFLNPSKVWPQPPYYVTQMAARNYLPNCLKVEIEANDPANPLDVTALGGKDGVSVQVINVGEKPIRASVRIDGAPHPLASATLTQIAGQLKDVNTVADPTHTTSMQQVIPIAGDNLDHTFPPRSFTIVRVE
ncbi:MAG TPA: alpha-L-arabinofuranosidase C-terminal domain-containing protein [Tepidisphaeraceae bacterium]|nr:alpha-L-arabinofuranosidase C-terminal domain-containing protein [Tepidisphaeraceae bacterium]